MTTPGGVPNLPKGALTVGTLGSSLQEHTPQVMRERASERVPTIFDNSTAGNILNDLSPFGIITSIWSAVNSLIAGADPADIQGPDDIPELLVDFIEGLPFVGQFVALLNDLLAALQGEYDGPDETMLAIQSFLAPLIAFLKYLFNGFLDVFLATGSSFLGAVFEWLGYFWGLFGEVIESLLNPLLELVKWAWETLDELVGGTADQILRALTEGIKWVWVNIGEPVVKAFGAVFEWIASVIDIDTLKAILQDITAFVGGFLNPAQFAEILKGIFSFFADLFDGVNDAVEFVSKLSSQIPFIGPLFSALTGQTEADGVSPSLASLAVWGQKVLTNTSQIPANNLFGEIPRSLLSMIPIANINIDSMNLLSQGDFASAATVESANGWSWDNTTNDPDSATSKGSAKLTTDGTARYLYSRQAIRVAGGDKVKLSARVKTASYAGTGSSVRLALVPFIGTTAQNEILFASRGASNGAWVTMTGSGDYAPWIVPAGVTSVIVKIGVTSASGSGSTVWFDNVDLRKEGLLGQSLVEFLEDAWRQAYNAVFPGNGGTGIWTQFVSAIEQLMGIGTNAQGAADTAQGTGIGIIDAIGKAVFGESTYNNLTSQVKTAMQTLIGALFGFTAPGQTAVDSKIQAAAVPPLSGSIIADGEISIDVLPTTDIGAAINPGVGSGALLSRRNTTNVNVVLGRSKLPAGFFDTLDSSSNDILAMRTGGTAGTGTQSDYAGIFKVNYAGWYLVEISLRLNPSISFGYQLAPLLYKGTNLTNPDAFKIGSDSNMRYSQASFIVYLNANETVQAGYDANGAANELLDADASGIETYFSMSLLNRSFA